MSAVEKPRGYRRTRRTAVGVGAAAILTLVATAPGGAAPGAPQQDAFNKGTGSATAIGYKVNPTTGNLSFGVTAGQSIAGHQNTGATGQSNAIDLGVIGVTLGGEGCDGGSPTLPADQQPQPVVARSGEEGAAEGKTETEQGMITKFARATAEPFAEAITTIAPTGDPKTAYISGGTTISHSGIVNGNTREALARTELGEVSLGGGVIKLQNLTWEAIHRTGAVNETIGTFTVGGILVNNQPVSLPGEGLAALDSLSPLLEPLGFKVATPKVRVEQGIVFVDPLKIAVIPAPARDAALGSVLTALQPLRDAVTKALLEQDCGNSTYITVADLGLGVVSASGEFGLEIGGVQTKTTDIDFFEFGSGGLLTPPPPATPAAPADMGSSDTGSADTSLDSSLDTDTSSSEADTAPTTDAAPSTEQALPISNKFVGKRGGAMAFVAGGGLLLLGAMAEGDRRKMLRAQREIPMEMA